MTTTTLNNQALALGSAVPPFTAHAISVSLPTWRDNVEYEAREKRVMDVMVSGYPRFFINPSIEKVCLESFSHLATTIDPAYSLLGSVRQDSELAASAVSCILRQKLRTTAALILWTNHLTRGFQLPSESSNISFSQRINKMMLLMLLIVAPSVRNHDHRPAVLNFT